MQQVRIDFDNPGLPQSLGVVEGESQSRIFQAALYKSGAAYTAPAGAVYSIMYRGFSPQNQGWYDTIEDGAGKRAACTVSGNVVTCELARQALRVPGHLTVVLCVSDAKGYMLKSWPIMADVRNDGYEDTGEIEMYFNLSGLAGNYLTQLEKAMANAETTKNTLTSTSAQVQKDIDAKAAAALESIPEEYTELDGSVKQLKEDLDYLNGAGITENIENIAYGKYTVGNQTTSSGGIVRVTPEYFDLPNSDYFVYFKGTALASSEVTANFGLYNLNGYSFAPASNGGTSISTGEKDVEAYGIVESKALKDGKKCIVFYVGNTSVTLISNKVTLVRYDGQKIQILVDACRNAANSAQNISIEKNYTKDFLIPLIETTRPYFNTSSINGLPIFNLYNSYTRAKKLVMIGDSTTDSAVSNYFDDMMRKYTKSGEVLEGTEIINMGKGGTTINWFLTDSSNQIGTAISHNAEIYTLCYGINDVREGNTSKEQLKNNLKTCVNRLLDETQGCVLLVTPNTMLSADVGGYNYVKPDSSAQAYSTLLKEAYVELNAMYASDRVQLVDMQDLIFGDTCVVKADTPFMSDQLHPNTLGQRCRADVIANAIGREIGVQLNKIRWVEREHSDDILGYYPLYVKYKGYNEVLSSVEIVSIDNEKAILAMSERNFASSVKPGDVMLFGNEKAVAINEIVLHGYQNYYFYFDFSEYAKNCNSWHVSVYRKIETN